MNITIDPAKCCGSGQCVLAAPDVFDQDDEGIVVLLDAAPDESLREDIEEAAFSCPTAAIELD